MAEQFLQIKRSLTEQWRFNRKKHVKGGGLVGLVWYRDPPFILIFTCPPLHCQCGDNLRLRSEHLEAEKPIFFIRYITFSKPERNFRMGFRQATFYLAELFRQATFYLAELLRQAMFYLAELFRQITSPYFMYNFDFFVHFHR